ncbi:hypothetical protein SAMN05444161_6803 [Rhizobiales bacterium GAS191]|nr:hypothetical protein SAMN05444161_6803 [Rhizobiales bacterium GAS191]
MCDYSLHHIASRPAKVGDRLVSTGFVNSSTRGFAAMGEPHVAVCLRPGTEIAFDKDVECDGTLAFFPRKLREKVARFTQIDMDKPHRHHDALEFPNGKCVLVTQLTSRQYATVLQLPASPGTAPTAEKQAAAAEAQRRDSFVA